MAATSKSQAPKSLKLLDKRQWRRSLLRRRLQHLNVRYGVASGGNRHPGRGHQVRQAPSIGGGGGSPGGFGGTKSRRVPLPVTVPPFRDALETGMNPFKIVWCVNTDADEHDERPMRRWRLWWCRWFGNDFARCWREIGQ